MATDEQPEVQGVMMLTGSIELCDPNTHTPCLVSAILPYPSFRLICAYLASIAKRHLDVKEQFRYFSISASSAAPVMGGEGNQYPDTIWATNDLWTKLRSLFAGASLFNSPPTIHGLTTSILVMNRLPDELIDIICRYVNTPTKTWKAPDSPSTSNLSLVSRRFNRIASVYLYSRFGVNLRHQHNHACLLRTLTDRPDLPDVVKHIYATIDIPDSQFKPGASIWSEDLFQIFRLLDRLESLESDQRWGMQFLMLRANIDITHSFFLPSLKALTLNALSWNFTTMEYILHLPCLQTLALDPFHLTCRDPGECESALDGRYEWAESPVKYLSIHPIVRNNPQPWHTTFLKTYLSKMSNLETLAIQPSVEFFGPYSCRYLLNLFSTQLRTSLRRLEFLDVAHDRENGDTDNAALSPDYKGTLDDLQASNIEYLKIEVGCLRQPEQRWPSKDAIQQLKIPPSVRHLELWDVDEYHFDDEEWEEYDKKGIADFVRHKLPNLDLLQLNMAIEEDGMQLVKKFEDCFATVGIRMETKRHRG
ncbi:hypothetical protein P154DRAFT_574392 [Amniculicola lignicola CBS 123094]|uniref:F-box domain-containing protein n=1 Tax=Amniculicola lignicola CBS 123094 TaxID=1392246 RepID=A0A6A5WWS1_9PLEO|nr:hypothetical protein P154DRAFT_574392 [Amniculicola lignicola CBS 123094]